MTTDQKRPQTMAAALAAHEIEPICDRGNIDHKAMPAHTNDACDRPAEMQCRLHNCTPDGEVVLLCREHLAAVRTGIGLRFLQAALHSAPVSCALCRHVFAGPHEVIWNIGSFR